MNKWDRYFLNVCDTISDNSECLSRKIGAIIVKDKSIISTGYNGPPRGIPHCSKRYDIDQNLRKELWRLKIPHELDQEMCPRHTLGYKSGEGLEWCIAGHAERNAIVNAARIGVCVNRATMYMNCPTPCTPCLIEIINAGIVRIVFTELHYYDLMAEWIIRNSTLSIRTFRL